MTYDPTSELHHPKVKFVAGIIIKSTYFDIQQRMFALKREERKTSQNNMLADITIKFRSINYNPTIHVLTMFSHEAQKNSTWRPT